MNYYFTDYEELEALRKENLKLKEERDKLLNLSAETIKECEKVNRKFNELKRVVYDHLKFDDKGVAEFITAKPVLDVIEASAKRLEKAVKGGK